MNEVFKDTTWEKLPVFYNTVDKLVMIAEQVLQGEMAEKKGDFNAAISFIENGIALKDSLIYNEPPDWFYPVRHHLGAVLLENKKYAEAEMVYKRDLELNRENGWSLMGLYLSLLNQNKTDEANAVKKRFDEAWKWAGIQITSSRII